MSTDISHFLDRINLLPTIAEEAMLKRCADELLRLYPGHQWGAYIERGVVALFLVSADHKQGWRVPARIIEQATDLTSYLRMVGGELLERYNVSRGPRGSRQIWEMPREFDGRLKAHF